MGIAYELPVHPEQAEASRGHMRFFYLDPPLPIEEYSDYTTGDAEVHSYAPFVIVSAADVPYSGPETYVFAADPHGRVASWSELDGSFRGGFDHERALAMAGEGYWIAGTPMPPEVAGRYMQEIDGAQKELEAAMGDSALPQDAYDVIDAEVIE